MRNAQIFVVAVLSAVTASLATMAITGALARPLPDPRGAPQVVHSSVAALAWTPLPEFGGSEAILYRSPDGKRVAAAFRESGAHSFTYPFDEFLYVTSGSARVTVRGRPSFMLQKGDVAYFEKGATVDFVFSDDFEDVTMLVDDTPVKWR
jgi:uncharacterized cupin superfamily protein